MTEIKIATPEGHQLEVLKRHRRQFELPDDRRVVVTGMGAVTPLGLTREETWEAALAGRSGIKLISDEERRDSRVQIAGEVRGFDPGRFLEPRSLKWVDRSAQLYLASTFEALDDAGLTGPDQIHPYDIGINVGTGAGGTTRIAGIQDIFRERGDKRIPATSIMLILIDRVASVTGMNRSLRGPTYSVTAACASSGYAIAKAYQDIIGGDAMAMVTGGADSTIDRMAIGSFAALRALSVHNSEPEKASRPFDRDADGFVVSEGAASLVLERLDYAMARKARIYAELVSYGNTADAEHDTAPSGEGAIRAIQIALAKGRIIPEEVDYVNAHATSTPIGDPAEVQVIRYVFGRHATRVPISATKSMTGHLLGATGALEAMFAILAIRDGKIPPTINLDRPIDPEMNFVPGTCQAREVRIALSNTFGFGGMNNALLFRRFRY